MPDMNGPEIPRLISPAQRLAAQADQAEADQSFRLMLAEDPVYSHVVTFAVASALSNVEWDSKRWFERGPQLVARLLDVEGVFNRFPTKDWPDRLAATWPLGGGVNLVSGITFRDKEEAGNDIHRVLPHIFDRSLVGQRRNDTPLFLDSSYVYLERPVTVYGMVPFRLGVTAVHSSEFGSTEVGVTPFIEPEQSKGFEDVFATLYHLTEDEAEGFPEEDPALGTGAGQLEAEEWQDQTGGESIATSSGHYTLSTQPEDHFAFHEALGVPIAKVEMAKRSFEAIVAHMGLPYELSEKARPI